MLNRMGWWMPASSFVLAVTLAFLYGPLAHSLLVRQATQCTGIVPPKIWNKELGTTRLGKVTGDRDGDNIKLTIENLTTAVTTTKDADKKCRVGTKDVCIEVFNSDGPPTGNTLSKESTIDKNKFPAGSTACLHYKSFVATPCDGGKSEQRLTRTATIKAPTIPEQPFPARNQDLFESFKGGTVPGPGFFTADTPGVFYSPGFTVADDATGEPVELTYNYVMNTLLFCESEPAAAVVWKFDIEIKFFLDGHVCNVTKIGTPVIHCVGTDAFNDIKKEIDKLKEEKQKKEKDEEKGLEKSLKELLKAK